MEHKGKEAVMRLKRVLLTDKEQIPSGLTASLRSDLVELLGTYFDVEPEKLGLEIGLDVNGRYTVEISLMTDRVKHLRSV
ncbi:MAG TPA: cell division topological specificity factor MinE [Candidatus Stercoripulliclostridium merdipullorum]|uniref:Cell division topological specificity factor MinE n=1 Tax=Candidatus Stercoripulliclostridium merdipullorum TaxID=2840952 RepID=A0A9D1SXR6_9FIRM|nr:cell division topological specificity factor MinE [Candidatus Stercoripulliclostridium merdipullorum]